jgi:hypothetical protein
MKKIYLYWFKKKGKYGNFGDELGPYIIRNLSGKTIYRILIPRSSIKLVLSYIKGLISKNYFVKDVNKIFTGFFLNGKYIISIGSIIGWGSGPRIVWGSGILSITEKIDDGKFLAVRGKYTQRRLLNLGYKSPEILGDPALLLPIVYEPSKEVRYKIGIVPHHSHYKDIIYNINNIDKNFKVINLIGEIENIIEEITSCEYIISTSLHGLIVAQAYRIPSLWYKYPKIELRGDNVKFYDYFSSVGIPEYQPYLLKEINLLDIIEVQKNFENNVDKTLIKKNLSLIQRRLINAAPFPILEKFKV